MYNETPSEHISCAFCFDKVMSISSQNIATCKLKNQLPDVIPRSLVAGVRGTLSLVAKAPASMNRVVDDGEKY